MKNTFRYPTATDVPFKAVDSVPGREDERPLILLVDDEPRLLSSLHDLLVDRPYRLITATCSTEAFEQLLRYKFDLVLLDLNLPDLSGHDLMDFINGNGLDASVIALSGDSDIEAAIGALKRGAYGYLRKPYSQEELLNTMDNGSAQAQAGS